MSTRPDEWKEHAKSPTLNLLYISIISVFPPQSLMSGLFFSVQFATNSTLFLINIH